MKHRKHSCNPTEVNYWKVTASVGDTFRVPAPHNLFSPFSESCPLPLSPVGKAPFATCREFSLLFSHLPHRNKWKYPYVLCISDKLSKHSYYWGSNETINSLHFGCDYHYNVFSIKMEVSSLNVKMPGQGLRNSWQQLNFWKCTTETYVITY